MSPIIRKIGICLLGITLILVSVVPITLKAETLYECIGRKVNEQESSSRKKTSEEISDVCAFEAGLAGKGPIDIVVETGKALLPNVVDIAGSVIGFLILILVKVAAFLLGMAGLLLDYILKKSVVNLKEELDKIKAINETWRTIRDIGNMSFIFILLYHGIKMILDINISDVKKIISGIVMAAILVNFSMFFTKIIIDASNIVTLGFYNSIADVGRLSIKDSSEKKDSMEFGFSGAFMKPLGITGLFDLSGFKEFGNSITDGNGGIKLVTIQLGMLAFILVTAFVFLAVSVLFIIRFLAIIILLIMSPIAFLSLGIPGLEGLSKKYWGTLSGQMLFGPIFMIYCWVILKLMGPGGLGGKFTLGMALASPTTDNVSVILNFLLLIGLMITAIVQAKEQATQGGIVSQSMVSKGQSLLGGAIFGGAGFVGRNSFGRIANNINTDELQRKADAGSRTAKMTLSAINKTKSSSFDARNTKTFDKLTGSIGGLGGVGSFGKGMPWNDKFGEGGASASKKASVDKSRAKLDEVVDRLKRGKKWNEIATFISTNVKDPKDQKYLYEKLSVRDRVSLENALEKSGNRTLSTQLRNSLSQEEQDKTEDAKKKVAASQLGDDVVNGINTLTDPSNTSPTVDINGQPKTLTQLLPLTGPSMLPSKAVSKLNNTALNHPRVIQGLNTKHLQELQKSNLDDATIINIVNIIHPGHAQGTPFPTQPTYANQRKQYDFINKQNNKDNWYI